MADSLMGEAIQVLLDSLASKEIIDFLQIHEVDNGLLEKFKTRLQSVTLVLNDAEEKQGKSQEVEAWQDELQDVVYHIEDLVDEISTEAQQQEFDTESHGEISPVGGIHLLGKRVKSHKKGIEKKMGQILTRLKSLAKRRYELGLKKGIQNEMKQSPSIPTSPSVDDSEVFGRDDDKEAIFELLLSDDASGEELSVIPIVGEVGIGKTALARLIYNDDRVREHFELKAWAHVSDHFDMFMVTKTIFESFTMQSCDLKDLNLLQVRLQEGVRGKKFLLVLDDVWAETYHDWEFLLSPFKGAAKASRVIVTTRIQSVASMVGTESAYVMRELSNTDSWSLFTKFAFGDQDLNSYPELGVIGKEIMELSSGLPLALRTLGALLGLKLQVEEWEFVWKRLIHFRSEKREVLSPLKLSYDHLFVHLKRCLGYCSIFPPEYEFEKKKLVPLWSAEGFLQLPRENLSMDEVGDEYFRELLLRSFLQPSNGNKSRFMMHDLMSHLAPLVFGKFCFRLEYDDSSSMNAWTWICHFSNANAIAQ